MSDDGYTLLNANGEEILDAEGNTRIGSPGEPCCCGCANKIYVRIDDNQNICSECYGPFSGFTGSGYTVGGILEPIHDEIPLTNTTENSSQIICTYTKDIAYPDLETTTYAGSNNCTGASTTSNLIRIRITLDKNKSTGIVHIYGIIGTLTYAYGPFFETGTILFADGEIINDTHPGGCHNLGWGGTIAVSLTPFNMLP